MVVVWSAAGFRSNDSQSGVAHAGILHCATSGNAAAVIRARVMCCGKAVLFLLAQLEARNCFFRPPLPVQDQWPPSKDQTHPLFPHLRFSQSAVSLGGTLPLASRDRFLYEEQECILDFLCWPTSVGQKALLNAVDCLSSAVLLFE